MPVRMSRMSPPPRSKRSASMNVLAVAGAAAKVGLEDGVAVGGEDLDGEVEAGRRPAVRPAVRIDDELVRRFGDFGWRHGQYALDLKFTFLHVITSLLAFARIVRSPLPLWEQ